MRPRQGRRTTRWQSSCRWGGHVLYCTVLYSARVCTTACDAPSLTSGASAFARLGTSHARQASSTTRLLLVPPPSLHLQHLLTPDSNGRYVLPTDTSADPRLDVSRNYCLALAAAPLMEASHSERLTAASTR